jgi:hypothetical protein
VEALRTPNPFTPDLEEELAPMSDIMSSGGRATNGGARPQGPIPVQTSPATVSRAAVIPPTEIMRRREERARAQQERAQATSEEQRRRLQGEWDEYDSQAASVTAPPPVQQQAAPQPTQATHRRTQSAAMPTARPQPGQPTTAVTYPQVAGQTSQAAGYATSAGVVQPPIKVPQSAQQAAPPGATGTRPRASTTRQPRPVQQPTAGPSRSQRPVQPAQAPRIGAAPGPPSRSAQEAADIRAEREHLPQAGLPAGTSAEGMGRRGDGSVSTFPHAFERWEMLSSKWEGMTSHWISRLQLNSEELQNQPMLAQLSRQVTDLSAAGANLFTALVELQKLRASSERKFQRWFHDTRTEMERQQELIGQLERALIQERRDRADDQVNWEKLVENARRTEHSFSRLNAEKDRELQIAKDESRRAWEELGRYEALERERQKALAQGLPVEIGGYTVYPRLFPESRQGSVLQRPSTQGDPRPSSRRGPQASHSIEDDPFVAETGAGDAIQEQSDAGTWSPSRSTAGLGPPSTSRTSAYTTAGYGTTAGYTSFSSPPGGPPLGFYSQANTHLDNHPSDEDLRYERDDVGNILIDEYGRPLSYRRGLHEARSSESEGENAPYTSFTNDPADRRRIPGTSSQAMGPAHGVAGPGAPSMQTRPEADFGFFNEEEEEGEDAGYGVEEQEEEEGGAHYHPTRLSDVPEEDELSRASEAGASRGGVTGAPF